MATHVTNLLTCWILATLFDGKSSSFLLCFLGVDIYGINNLTKRESECNARATVRVHERVTCLEENGQFSFRKKRKLNLTENVQMGNSNTESVDFILKWRCLDVGYRRGET